MDSGFFDISRFAKKVHRTSLECAGEFDYFAMPKKTARERSTSNMATESSRPNESPILSRDTVTLLSSIICERLVNPLFGAGSSLGI